MYELTWEFWAAFAYVISAAVFLFIHWLVKSQTKAENKAKAKEAFQREIDDLDNCHK